jgi:hypothetical protein
MSSDAARDSRLLAGEREHGRYCDTERKRCATVGVSIGSSRNGDAARVNGNAYLAAFNAHATTASGYGDANQQTNGDRDATSDSHPS